MQMGGDPRKMVNGPAVVLIVLNAIGIVYTLTELWRQVTDASSGLGYEFSIGTLEYTPSTEMHVAIYVVGLLLGGFIIYGLIQMKNLRKRTLAMTARILNMIPFFGTCCLLGLPCGIWALTVMGKPEVKAAFQD